MITRHISLSRFTSRYVWYFLDFFISSTFQGKIPDKSAQTRGGVEGPLWLLPKNPSRGKFQQIKTFWEKNMLICSSIVFELINSRFPTKGWKDGTTRWSEPQACAKLQKSALSRQSTFSHHKLNHYNHYITMKILKPISTLYVKQIQHRPLFTL